MANRTQPTRRPAASGRFTRPGGTTGRSPSARRPSAPSRRPTIRRRPQQKTGMAKLADSVAGMLPGTAASKKGGGGGKGRTAGLALLAGAAGLALKNRDKLPGIGGRKGSGTGDRTAHADAPATPVVIDRQPGGTPPPAA
jgi:hypothetical protein